MNNLGAVLYQSGRIREAADLYRQVLPVSQALYGAEHPEIGVLLHNLGNAELMLGQIDDAEPLLRRSLAMIEKFKGKDHDDLVPPLNLLAMIDGYSRRLPRAQAEAQRALRIARLPNHGVLLHEVLLNVADLALRSGHAEAAAAPLAESRRLLEAAYPIARNSQEVWRYALWDTVNAEWIAHEGDAAASRRIIGTALPVIAQRFEVTGFNSLLARRRSDFVEQTLARR
jgi:tetratricopeptide (TPR) repeat protein